MTWQIAHADGKACGSCQTPIGVGEPYATVTKAHLPRCEACIKQMFDTDPPAEVWAPAPPTDTVPPPLRLASAGLADLTKTYRSGRDAQLPEGDR